MSAAGIMRSRAGRALPPDVEALDALVARIRDCRICRDTPLGKPLPHEPRPVLVPSTTARVLIAGQAPGTKVHVSGMPFTDGSGNRLRDWLAVSPEEFYDPDLFAFLPMGFCFPGQDPKGGDLPPRRECAPAWRAPLLAAMPQLDLVVAVGLYAQAWHIGIDRRSLSERVRDWQAIATPGATPRVIPLPHPSWRNSGWLKKNPWFEMELLPFLRAEIHSRIRPVGRKRMP